MGYFKVVGMNVSERHPFHGAYIEPDMYDFDIASLDARYKGVQGFGLDANELWGYAKNPLLRGLLVGSAAWSVARAVGADAAISRRVGIVSGGLEAILAAVYNWLRAEQPAAAVDTVSPTPSST